MRLDDAGPRTWLLATAAGWALLAWVLALAGMGGRIAPLPDDPGLVRPLPPLRARRREPAWPAGAVRRDRHAAAVRGDRRPKPFFAAGRGRRRRQRSVRLRADQRADHPQACRLAILQPPDGSQSLRVKLGDAPESHPAWRLSAVDAAQRGVRRTRRPAHAGTAGVRRPGRAAADRRPARAAAGSAGRRARRRRGADRSRRLPRRRQPSAPKPVAATPAGHHPRSSPGRRIRDQRRPAMTERGADGSDPPAHRGAARAVAPAGPATAATAGPDSR